MSHNVLIVGATSTIAQAVARQLAMRGNNLILAGRRIEELDRLARDLRLRHEVQVAVERFDALKIDGHGDFFIACTNALAGELDGVIVAYGYLGSQHDAQQDFNEARTIIETNFTSCVWILEHAAAYLEARGAGYICVISSVAGDRGRQSNYIYGSAKAGLTTYLQGLRNRLFKKRIAVITVKPGFVDTKMTYGRKATFLVAKPERVARDICRAIQKRKDVVYTPWFWWGIMAIIKSIPETIFKRMKL